MIAFDNSSEEKTWLDVIDFGVKADPQLIHVLRYIDGYMHEYGGHVIITSFIRNEAGVHSTGRAADLRSRTFSEGACRIIEAHVNHHFPRRDQYPTILYHDIRGAHFHVQVPV